MVVRWTFCFLGLPLLMLGVVWAQAPKLEVTTKGSAEAEERTVSNSNQFIVYGGKKQQRTDLANRCEELRRDFCAILQIPADKWTYTFVIQLNEAQRKPVYARIFPLPSDTFRFQMDLRENRFRMEEFETEFVRLLLLEQAFSPWNANIVNDGVDHWLAVGLDELMEFRRAGRPSDIYTSLTQAHQIMSIKEVMEANPDLLQDTLSKKVFRACAAALVQAMLDQNDGHKRLLAMLRDLAVEKVPTQDLMKRHFAPFRQDDKAVAKWWALQMALMSQRSAFELLSVSESERYLTQALRVHLGGLPVPEVDPKDQGKFSRFRIGNKKPETTDFESGVLEDYELYLADPRSPAAIKNVQEDLLRLRNQVFPLHKPLIGDYLNISAKLLEGETKGLKEEFQRLSRMRAEIYSVMSGVDDYMNWYTTTQLQEETDAFEGYEGALDLLEDLESAPRYDPISRYMDDIERELAP